MSRDFHNPDTFQEGVTPVQAFVCAAVVPGPDLAPRLGRPVRTPAQPDAAVTLGSHDNKKSPPGEVPESAA
jgi:hypothetical protein